MIRLLLAINYLSQYLNKKQYYTFSNMYISWYILNVPLTQLFLEQVVPSLFPQHFSILQQQPLREVVANDTRLNHMKTQSLLLIRQLDTPPGRSPSTCLSCKPLQLRLANYRLSPEFMSWIYSCHRIDKHLVRQLLSLSLEVL